MWLQRRVQRWSYFCLAIFTKRIPRFPLEFESHDKSLLLTFIAHRCQHVSTGFNWFSFISGTSDCRTQTRIYLNLVKWQVRYHALLLPLTTCNLLLQFQTLQCFPQGNDLADMVSHWESVQTCPSFAYLTLYNLASSHLSPSPMRCEYSRSGTETRRADRRPPFSLRSFLPIETFLNIVQTCRRTE